MTTIQSFALTIQFVSAMVSVAFVFSGCTKQNSEPITVEEVASTRKLYDEDSKTTAQKKAIWSGIIGRECTTVVRIVDVRDSEESSDELIVVADLLGPHEIGWDFVFSIDRATGMALKPGQEIKITGVIAGDSPAMHMADIACLKSVVITNDVEPSRDHAVRAAKVINSPDALEKALASTVDLISRDNALFFDLSDEERIKEVVTQIRATAIENIVDMDGVNEVERTRYENLYKYVQFAALMTDAPGRSSAIPELPELKKEIFADPAVSLDYLQQLGSKLTAAHASTEISIDELRAVRKEMATNTSTEYVRDALWKRVAGRPIIAEGYIDNVSSSTAPPGFLTIYMSLPGRESLGSDFEFILPIDIARTLRKSQEVTIKGIIATDRGKSIIPDLAYLAEASISYPNKLGILSAGSVFKYRELDSAIAIDIVAAMNECKETVLGLTSGEISSFADKIKNLAKDIPEDLRGDPNKGPVAQAISEYVAYKAIVNVRPELAEEFPEINDLESRVYADPTSNMEVYYDLSIKMLESTDDDAIAVAWSNALAKLTEEFRPFILAGLQETTTVENAIYHNKEWRDELAEAGMPPFIIDVFSQEVGVVARERGLNYPEIEFTELTLREKRATLLKMLVFLERDQIY